ncbi:MAG: phytanoyl-CoA dioxygenase family protein [Planctomycetes bacterium]|nr:phytanoyl-CoA dioxygenase family protein [Planctomycetota bacterium]
MNRSARRHQEEFQELGYTVFQGVFSPEEVAFALPIFDEIISPRTAPPVVCSNGGARRQLNSALYCEPRLSAFGGFPIVLETVSIILDKPFRLTRSPVPTVTYPGKAGGVPGQNWTGHVDWDAKPPVEKDALYIYGIIHFTTVEPNGGGFTVVPRSHRVVEQNLSNAELSTRMFQQKFSDFPGLETEREMQAKAGDILYYHPFLVHGASDNQSTRTRKVLHTHYIPIRDEETERGERESIRRRFHPAHLTVMDERFRRIIGL